MTQKATWLYNGVARGGALSYGFSETWYSDDAPAVLLPKMEDFAELRMIIMARGCGLYGSRVADTAPGSRAYTQRPTAPIQAAARMGQPNVPQDAVLCQCFGTANGTVKRFWFHNVPDNVVDDADFVADKGIPEKCRNLINALARMGFKFRYQLQDTASAEIESIAANGDVVLVGNLAGAAQGSLVQLFHVRGTDGRGKRGKYRIQTFTDGRHFKLAHWPGDEVANSGKLRIVTYAYTAIQQIPNAGIGSDPTIRPGVRKCGRPFGQLRGRAVARR